MSWKLFLLFFTLKVSTASEVQQMGSILFNDHGFPKKCFVQNDVALLSIRLKFQDLLPNNCEGSLLNDEGITAIVRYFYGINEVIEEMGGDDLRQLMQSCYYDMLGSYLKHQILPIAKFSFYTGNVTYSTALNLVNLFERCKELLDTNGEGWAEPISDFSKFSINIDPISIGKTPEDDAMKACGNLAMNQNDDDNDEEMLVALPKMETEENEELSTIWLPLKRKHIFNIKSRTSTFILFRYFVMVTQCYSYQGINQGIFNRKLKLWIVENVLPYLDDEEVYPAFGAVLRILETIKGPNDSGYQGSKSKKSKYEKALGGIEDIVREEGAYENDDDYLDWWFRVGIAGSAVFIVGVFLILFILKYCKKCRKVEVEVAMKSKKRKFFKQKCLDCFNVHSNEPDENYQYKKVPTNARSVVFENEKRSRRKKKSKEQFDLPLLGAEESEEEEIYKKTPIKKMSNSTFKISESSDEGNKKSKKTPEPRRPKGICQRLRAMSPLRPKKPADSSGV